MIVSKRHRYVFIEVPHTGSTAAAAELCELYDGEAVYHKHSTYAEFFHLARADERRYLTFAGVRNPLDAVVTDYLRYHMNPGGHYTNPRMLDENGGWVTRQHLEKFRFVTSGADFEAYFRRFHRRIHFNWYLIAARPFDAVMRNETLGCDFEQTLRSMGIRPVRALPVSNKTTDKKGFASYYTPAIRDQAARTYGPFMEKWGYAFPAEWGPVKVPIESTLAFRAMEATARALARVSRTAPHDPRTRDVRRALGDIWRPRMPTRATA